jgi:hypothetical protein
MVNITAVFGNMDGLVRSIDTDSGSNNVSSSLYEANGIDNPFLLGVSKFKEKKTFVDEKSPSFISNIISDDDGKFPQRHIFVCRTSNTKFLKISFDTINNEYPTEMLYGDAEGNDTIIKLNSPIVILPITNNYLWVEISNWNKPNRPLIISEIASRIRIDNILNVEIGNQDRSDTLIPSWGVKFNTGYVEFVDIFDIVSQLKKTATISNEGIFFYLNSHNRIYPIAKNYIKTASHNITNGISKIEFQDVLAGCQTVGNIEYPLESPQSCMTLFEKLEQDINVEMKYADTSTKEYLQNLILGHPYLDKGSSWSQIVKLCEVAMCYIYCDYNGVPCIKYDGGR